MSNEDGTLWLTYNGEIFNHAELRPDLEKAGHRYRTRCDSETILHAYEEYGSACVERFRGMFAFALWNQNTRTLFCARDRLGIKPLYYYWNGSVFAFASEIKALLEHPAVPVSLDEPLLAELLAFGYVSGHRTLFAGIRKLMPGHWLEFAEGGEPRIARYWDVPPPGVPETRGDREWIDECRARLEETVRMRLMSDVPLGVCLSGGVDSSAIAALMKRMTTTPVVTFAVGYAEAEYSELEYARRVSETIGTDHHEIRVGREDFFQALPKLIWHEDEPIAWPSSVSLYFVSKLASERVKVVLTGEGSDELFAGYHRYRHYLLNRRGMDAYRLLPAAFRRRVRDQIAGSRLLSGSLQRKMRHTFLGREDSFESLQLDNLYCAFSAEQQRSLLRGWQPAPSPYENYLGYWNARPEASPLARMLYADQKTYLVELLMKQDQMSMANSIESRVPFLDHPLVEFAALVPDRLKIRGGTGKYILKQAVADLLPASIIHRKKMGFPTPLRQWLRGPGAGRLMETLRAPDGLLREYIEPAALETLMERHARGIEDATDRLWSLLNLQIWGDLFLTGKRERWLAGSLTEIPASGR